MFTTSHDSAICVTVDCLTNVYTCWHSERTAHVQMHAERSRFGRSFGPKVAHFPRGFQITDPLCFSKVYVDMCVHSAHILLPPDTGASCSTVFGCIFFFAV